MILACRPLSLSPSTKSVSFQPEIELLLRCSRTQVNPQNRQKIQQLIQDKIDWLLVIKIAYRQGVIPLLYYSLKATTSESVPPPIFNQLHSFFQKNTLHNLFLTQELIKLLPQFQEREIPVIPYKGPILAASCYGNLSLRHFCDLDLLVHPKDFDSACKLLTEQGYQLHLKLDWEYGFFHPKTQVHIDLHQGLTPNYLPFKIQFNHLWQQVETLSLADTEIVSFKIEDLLLILSVQVAKDSWCMQGQLSKICDIAELINSHPELDWEYLLNSAHNLGSVRMLFLSLYLAHNLLDTSLPTAILQKIERDSIVDLLTQHVKTQLFDFEKTSSQFSTFSLGVTRAIFHLRMRERLGDRLPYIWYLCQKFIFPSSE